MFSDNLTVSLLLICENRRFSYEQASERCGCSSRHFGGIVRGQTTPSLRLLERMCTAFEATPNQLLGVETGEGLSYRTPMEVTGLRTYRSSGARLEFPVCPRCGVAIEREYQSYCDRCGQSLNWSAFGKAAARRR